jgi:undecaprenyl-diphosphatase
MRPDEQLLVLSNSIVETYPDLSSFLFFLSTNPITKGIPVVLVIWSLWFYRRDGLYPHRPGVLATLTIAILAIGLGRALAVSLPFSLRPIHTPDLELTIDGFVRQGMLEGMSSLPSDHAVLFAALCTGIFFVNRATGILIGCYCFLVVLLPRIIFGLHWPSDIAAGIFVGAALVVVTFGWLRQKFSGNAVLELAQRYEVLFYPALFLLTFQISTMFDSARAFVKAAARAVLM